MNRRDFVRHTLGGATLAVVAPQALRAAVPVAMTVYKSPTCGCCKEWIKHVEANGFTCKVINMDDVTPMKRQVGVPEKMESCHTALVGAYVIEGHVPADLIKQILAKKPTLLGLSVPGMPLGAPGMETSGPAQPYKVLAFMRDGTSRMFASRG